MGRLPSAARWWRGCDLATRRAAPHRRGRAAQRRGGGGGGEEGGGGGGGGGGRRRGAARGDPAAEPLPDDAPVADRRHLGARRRAIDLELVEHAQELRLAARVLD